MRAIHVDTRESRARAQWRGGNRPIVSSARLRREDTRRDAVERFCGGTTGIAIQINDSRAFGERYGWAFWTGVRQALTDEILPAVSAYDYTRAAARSYAREVIAGLEQALGEVQDDCITAGIAEGMLWSWRRALTVL